MSVHYPTTHRRYMHYRKKDDFIVIKYGAEWCGPCKRAKPVLERLAIEYPTVYFLDVDVDTEITEGEEAAMIDHTDFNNIKSLPTFKFFVNKELVREFTGLDNERLDRYVKRYSDPKLVQPKTETVPETEVKDDEDCLI